ncbi:MAG: hypothetical protein KME02_10280 [Aphanothece saxicola GSE-SYN-MK-01-06B]|nr:hypothetical protein [Aphanothece saxicola GSE-SYN-MK-01-06B]
MNPIVLLVAEATTQPAQDATNNQLLGFEHLHTPQMQKPLLHLAAVLVALPLLSPDPAVAQKRIPKLPGNDQCPLGYVNDLKQHCNSPIYYQVRPTYGKPCLSGWMNIGAGYCKKKTLGIF